MTNQERIQQLIFRKNRIEDLTAVQTEARVQTLLQAEAYYVREQIEFYEWLGDRPAPLVQLPP